MGSCRQRLQVAEQELKMVACAVATLHSGRCRRDRARYEYGGVNVKTYVKYLHVLHMWVDFCLAMCMYSLRWQVAPLSQAMWVSIAQHFYTYSGKAIGLAATSLESYLRMLSHVLIYMGNFQPWQVDQLHKQQAAVIQRVVEQSAACTLHVEASATPSWRGTMCWWTRHCSCC